MFITLPNPVSKKTTLDIVKGVLPLSLSKTLIVIGVKESVVTESFTAIAWLEGGDGAFTLGETCSPAGAPPPPFTLLMLSGELGGCGPNT